MNRRVPVSLLLWSGFVLLIQYCGGQVLNCTCDQGHGKCDENGECRCDPGWGGLRCDDCVRMPGCVHGSCHQPWQCTCEPGWAGRFCDKDIDVCEKEQPCQNGATCSINEAGEYNCLCPDNFHGKHCEFKTGPCHKTRSPCKNGGLCEDQGGYALQLSCRCLAGFTGPRCETNMDDCLMRPCANGATCLDGINRFSCLCPAGFTGRFCTINLDDCASQPCLNRGRCIDRVNSFHCVCPPGFTGTTCEVPFFGRSRETQAPSRGTYTGAGEGRGGAWVTQTRPSPSTHLNLSHEATASGSEGRLLKISVKEVVTQKGTGGLTEEQFITLLVLGGMTLVVVALTVGLVLRGQLKDRCGHCRCRSPSSHLNETRHRQQPRSHLAPAEQECKISFLQTPVAPELEKKKLNTDVI
ncbi:protein delta homolog 2 [Chanos chanos]|uniref:Protein delta homolog 2 n=1 Tax=Chanos chanos TaxID=29144 RepID=A0A6J2VAN8_CHACN|nr:protein delta homolog 2 [Chanos chanos]